MAESPNGTLTFEDSVYAKGPDGEFIRDADGWYVELDVTVTYHKSESSFEITSAVDEDGKDHLPLLTGYKINRMIEAAEKDWICRQRRAEEAARPPSAEEEDERPSLALS